MDDRVQIGGLSVAGSLHRFVDRGGAARLGGRRRTPSGRALAPIVHDLAPRNRELLAAPRRAAGGDRRLAPRARRAAPDADGLHGVPRARSATCVAEPATTFAIDTDGVDPEIATHRRPAAGRAGDQRPLRDQRRQRPLGLAVRRAVRHRRARATAPRARRRTTRPAAPRSIAWARALPRRRRPARGRLARRRRRRTPSTTAALVVDARRATPCRLADPAQFAGYRGDAGAPDGDRAGPPRPAHRARRSTATHAVGATDAAGVADVVLESAVTTIIDFEDSVAAVDAADKVVAYRNWLGLMQGDLAEEVTKGGTTFTRRLDPDRDLHRARRRRRSRCRGRALLLVRNVGHLMTTDAVLDARRQRGPRGPPRRDGHRARRPARPARRPGGCATRRTGSIYVVKPKMHGPDEVAFTDELFARVEDVLGLPPLHREDRDHGRGAAHHASTSRSASAPRATGSRSSTPASSTAPATRSTPRWTPGRWCARPTCKTQPWITAYEDRNVDVGLACGLRGRAQIGKGMWAAPDLMADMLEPEDRPPAGRRQLRLGAVADRGHAARHPLPPGRRARPARSELPRRPRADARRPADASRSATRPSWTDERPAGRARQQRRRASSATSCAGSTRASAARRCPTSTTSPLMEDRATCRISSQHIANWLQHGVVDADAGRRDAAADGRRRRRARTPATRRTRRWRPPSTAPRSAPPATWSSRASSSRRGYTEPILHRRRASRKQRATGSERTS